MKLIHVFSIFATPQSFFNGQFGYLAKQGYEIVLVSSDAPLAAEFAERNGIKFVPVEIPRSMSPIAIMKAIHYICCLIKTERPDAIFGHTPVGALCAMIAARLCGVKKRVYYRHGLIYTTMTGIKYAIFKKEEQFVARLATHVINVSHSLSKLAVADHLNSDKKQYVLGYGTCGGIDAQNIFNPALLDKSKVEDLKYKTGFAEASLVFGFCGRLCNDKGIPELVDGFEMFQKLHPNVKTKLLLIGRFDTRDGLSEEKKRQIKMNKDIVISGHIDKAEIPYYYTLLDCFVFPSHREGFGMCVVEASAMEIPVLDSKAHGCIDAIVEHETGEYIDPSAEGICKGMELMLDADLRKCLGKRGREIVLERYDFSVMWPLVNELYYKILK
ncbi:glycosyltransferase [Bacteroides congonensis]|uniref:glycosyltransferase n=1 Tax=Bacteroides congonensis TaxID=1871006 RepID=UPI002675DB4A|nr:glycosyltransferase [Bacteroides congonensis]